MINTEYWPTRGVRIDIQYMVFLETVITTAGKGMGSSEEIFLLATWPVGSIIAGGFTLLNLLQLLLVT